MFIYLHGLDMSDKYTNSILKDIFLKLKIYIKDIFLKHKIYIVSYADKTVEIHLNGVETRDIYNDLLQNGTFYVYEITHKIIHGR